MSDHLTFSVIVPTYNRAAALGQCLAALAKQDYPRDRFEVIVVNDGGQEDPTSLIESQKAAINVRLLQQSNAGPGVARNTGAAAATGEFLAFTDDDCMPNPHWLAKLAQGLEGDPTVIAGGTCVNAYPDNLYCVASQVILDVINLHFNRDHQNAMFFPSDNIAMQRRRFLELGGFDPEFRWSEDRDLCDRWTTSGGRLVFKADAAVLHARTMGLRGFCRQHFGYGRGAWRFHRGRQLRQSGKFEVEGSFYLKCFGHPWRTEPVWRAIPLTVLLMVWQVVNTAGFFYERFTAKAPVAIPGRIPEGPSHSPGHQAEQASK